MVSQKLKLMFAPALASIVFGGSAQAEEAKTTSSTNPSMMLNQKEPTPEFGNKSMWFQYLSAGETAALQHDNNLAKRYWMGALTALEQTPKPNSNALMLVQYSSLQRHLIDMYTSALAIKDLDVDERVKLNSEQVKTYERLAELNKKFVEPDNLLVVRSQERTVKARAELEKAKEDAKTAKEEAKAAKEDAKAAQ